MLPSLTTSLGVLLILAALSPASALAVTPPPTLAEEDTIALPSGSLPEVVVTAPRVTLEEILRRVAEGEARRDAQILDQAFTATVRVMKNTAQGRPELVSEVVTRVYKKKPEWVREIPLRRWPAKRGAAAQVEFTPSTAEGIVNFAFSPRLRGRFRFRIIGRELVGGHVIYRVGFEPRSPLAPFAPRGQVWIDTNEFVILRQECHFDRSPAPLLFKSIDRFVVERAPSRDGVWVMARMLLRAQTTLPLPKLGRSFDLAVLLSDYQVNAGLEDSFFAGPGSRRSSRRGEDD